MTTVTTHNPVRSDLAATASPEQTTTHTGSRGWAFAGLVAGLTGAGSIVATSMVNAIYDDKLSGSDSRVLAKLADQTHQMLAFHVLSTISALTLVVFAAGLHRRLRSTITDGLAPLVAFVGLVGTAVVVFLGNGLDTEFAQGVTVKGQVTASSATMYNHWIGTIPWCWGLAGLTGLALFVAARQRAVPRWIGFAGLVLGGLAVICAVAPIQYMAVIPAAAMIIITSLGFAVGDRAHRA